MSDIVPAVPLTNVSILGCGWLGLPLAKHLINEKFTLKGSTTSPEKLSLLAEEGISPFLIVLSPEIADDNIANFLSSDIIIINLPPGRRRKDVEAFHSGQITNLIHELKKSSIKKVIYVSSTSVYNTNNRIISEKNNEPPIKPVGKAMMKAETLLQAAKEFDTTILRLSGLVGYNRNPANFLTGGKCYDNGAAPVNIVHRDDCVNIIHQIIIQNKWGETFNVCSDKHPSREEYYTGHALKLGIEPPVFSKEKKSVYKIISSEKLKRELGYIYKYPDPALM